MPNDNDSQNSLEVIDNTPDQRYGLNDIGKFHLHKRMGTTVIVPTLYYENNQYIH